MRSRNARTLSIAAMTAGVLATGLGTSTAHAVEPLPPDGVAAGTTAARPVAVPGTRQAPVDNFLTAVGDLLGGLVIAQVPARPGASAPLAVPAATTGGPEDPGVPAQLPLPPLPAPLPSAPALPPAPTPPPLPGVPDPALPGAPTLPAPLPTPALPSPALPLPSAPALPAPLPLGEPAAPGAAAPQGEPSTSEPTEDATDEPEETSEPADSGGTSSAGDG